MNDTKGNNRPKRPMWQAGGQHRGPVGVSTMDGETDDERVEHLRRAYYELHEDFDEDRARRMMAVSVPVAKPVSLVAAFEALVASNEGVPW